MGNKHTNENTYENANENLMNEEKEAITLSEFINDITYRNHRYFSHKYFIKIKGVNDDKIPIENILNIDECFIKKVIMGDTVLPNCWFFSFSRALNATALSQYITSFMEINDIQGSCTVSPIYYDKLWHYNSRQFVI